MLTIQSELGGGQHGLLRLKMQPDTYQTVIRHDFELPDRPLQAASVPDNAATAQVPRYIHHNASQVDKWLQMVNAEDILKQKLLESLDEKYFKGQRQAYINYSKLTLAGIFQHIYYDHGKISPMDIEESAQKMN